MSRDPIGISGGANLYAFGNNSPPQARDPLGLKTDAEFQKECDAELAEDVPDDPCPCPEELVKLSKKATLSRFPVPGAGSKPTGCTTTYTSLPSSGGCRVETQLFYPTTIVKVRCNWYVRWICSGGTNGSRHGTKDLGTTTGGSKWVPIFEKDFPVPCSSVVYKDPCKGYLPGVP